MRLFIAEKPSLAEAIASELGTPAKRAGYFEAGGDRVAWCFGHMLEMAAPDDYDPRFKKWNAQDLPIVPDEWKLLPKPDAAAQLKILGQLLDQADEVVHAGDPDREGQLLVDEVLDHHHYRKPVRRIWLAANDSVSVRRALDSLRENSSCRGMHDAALARQRADWLIGMNLSRAYTLASRSQGGEALLTVGRVQTPTLALVVARDLAREAFKPTNFHRIQARFKHANGDFSAWWQIPEDLPGLDDEGRLIDTTTADAVRQRVAGQPGHVQSYKSTPKREGAPRAFSLASLVTRASKEYGYTAAQITAGAQALYETHKLASYPGTDSEFLPESQHSDGPAILAAVAAAAPELASLVAAADASRRSSTWVAGDDKRVQPHHGIVPTQASKAIDALPEIERNLYLLIARAYVAQFYPAHEYLATELVAAVGADTFLASGKVITEPGWRRVYDDADDEAGAGDEDDALQALPVAADGDSLECLSAERFDRKTAPPPAFTEGTLIRAMANIHRYVDDEAERRLLREGDGLGTGRTREPIITDLKRREFLTTKGKALLSTPLGRGLIAALPAPVKSPSLTAQYERQLREIESGTHSVAVFVDDLVAFVRDQVSAAQSSTAAVGVPDAGPECPTCQQGRLRRIKGSNGFFWGCSRYREGCKATFPDKKGAPDLAAPVTCPTCKQGVLRSRTGSNGKFWSCSRYPECKTSFDDKRGKPDLAPKPKGAAAPPKPRARA